MGFPETQIRQSAICPLLLSWGGGGLDICEIKYGYHDNKRDGIKIDLAFISGDKRKSKVS